MFFGERFFRPISSLRARTAVVLKDTASVNTRTIVGFLNGKADIPEGDIDNGVKPAEPKGTQRLAQAATTTATTAEAPLHTDEAEFDPDEIIRSFKKKYPNGAVLPPVTVTPTKATRASERLALRGVKRPTLVREYFYGDIEADTFVLLVPDETGIRIEQVASRRITASLDLGTS